MEGNSQGLFFLLRLQGSRKYLYEVDLYVRTFSSSSDHGLEELEVRLDGDGAVP